MHQYVRTYQEAAVFCTLVLQHIEDHGMADPDNVAVGFGFISWDHLEDFLETWGLTKWTADEQIHIDRKLH